MSRQEVRIASGAEMLAGTLALPVGAGPWPLVIFIGCSGPVDRDENMPGQRLDIFNTIAENLAARGVASVRHDKRGAGRSSGDYLRAGLDDFRADAEAVLQSFADDARFTARILIGHSEGAVLAAQIALSQPVDGVVLLTPFVEDGEKILMDQAARLHDFMRARHGFSGWRGRIAMWLFGDPVRRQRRLIARAKSTKAPVLRLMFRPVPARQLRDLIALDMGAVYARLRTPALLIGAARTRSATRRISPASRT